MNGGAEDSSTVIAAAGRNERSCLHEQFIFSVLIILPLRGMPAVYACRPNASATAKTGPHGHAFATSVSDGFKGMATAGNEFYSFFLRKKERNNAYFVQIWLPLQKSEKCSTNDDAESRRRAAARRGHISNRIEAVDHHDSALSFPGEDLMLPCWC